MVVSHHVVAGWFASILDVLQSLSWRWSDWQLA